MTTQQRPEIIRTPSSWIEGEAEAQLQRVARLPGIDLAIGMPDLHPGKGSPVGAVYFSRSHLFPYLVGNDIGCGMALWQTEVPVRSVKLERWERRLRSGELEGPWDGDQRAWLEEHNAIPCGFEHSLGTLGGGNHFAEVLKVSDIADQEMVHRIDLQTDKALLLVHSGSRGFGEQILRAHVDQWADAGLPTPSPDAQAYRNQHNHAVGWAEANRALIAHRIGKTLGFNGRRLLDLVHNSVTEAQIRGERGWLHRKGAAPSTAPVVPIPGSRGAPTYLVTPTGDGELNGHSLAHGAGRKWKRSESKGRLERRYTIKDLQRTKLGSRVVCEDRKLLYEEAPQAYKSIEDVVQALVTAGVAKIVATLTPLITYKTARP